MEATGVVARRELERAHGRVSVVCSGYPEGRNATQWLIEEEVAECHTGSRLRARSKRIARR